MNTQLFMCYGVPALVLLCLCSVPAECDTPGDKIATDPTTKSDSSRPCGVPVADNESIPASGTPKADPAICDDSNPATNDKCVAGACVNEPVSECPCVDEYAAAVAAYNARNGAPLTAWLDCDDTIAGVGGRIAYATKSDPEPPDWVTVILVAKGRWGYGYGISRLCEAWTYNGVAGDFGRPPVGKPTPHPDGPYFSYGRHAHLSTEEVLACEQLIRATTVCPN